MMSELERLKRRIDDLTTLLEVNATMAADMRLDRVIARIAQYAVTTGSAEAAILWFADDHGNLAPLATSGGGSREGLAKLRLAPGEGVPGRVSETGQPLVINDVRNHPRWEPRLDELTGFQTSTLACVPMISRGKRLGVLHVINKHNGTFDDEDVENLVDMASLAAITLDNSLVLQQAHAMSNSMVEAFSAAIDARDPFSHGHSAKVAEYSLFLGKTLGLTEAELERLRRAALLHDVGKLSIPDLLLRKVVPFTPEEEKLWRAHTMLGSDLLGRLKPVGLLAEAVSVAKHHHEQANGSGYPEGLTGEAIPLFARIVAVADCFVRLTTDKPPHHAVSMDEALGMMEKMGGNELDAACTAAFIETMIRGKPGE